jgi:hypothetical protein
MSETQEQENDDFIEIINFLIPYWFIAFMTIDLLAHYIVTLSNNILLQSLYLILFAIIANLICWILNIWKIGNLLKLSTSTCVIGDFKGSVELFYLGATTIIGYVGIFLWLNWTIDTFHLFDTTKWVLFDFSNIANSPNVEGKLNFLQILFFGCTFGWLSMNSYSRSEKNYYDRANFYVVKIGSQIGMFLTAGESLFYIKGGLLIALVIVGLCVYLLPSIIARIRNHQSKLAIFFLNVFAGWTALGWIVSLVWSGTALKKAE